VIDEPEGLAIEHEALDDDGRAALLNGVVGANVGRHCTHSAPSLVVVVPNVVFVTVCRNFAVNCLALA
jgi:hypothetical protein